MECCGRAKMLVPSSILPQPPVQCNSTLPHSTNERRQRPLPEKGLIIPDVLEHDAQLGATRPEGTRGNKLSKTLRPFRYPNSARIHPVPRNMHRCHL
jgi:hypothetical protein